MNSASAYVTWQSWSEKWGHWNRWRRGSQCLDNMEPSEDLLRMRISKPLSMILPSSKNDRRDDFSPNSNVIAPRPRISY
jgi:hypothetical protein